MVWAVIIAVLLAFSHPVLRAAPTETLLYVDDGNLYTLTLWGPCIAGHAWSWNPTLQSLETQDLWVVAGGGETE
jgi:hypothetical protein